MTRFVCIFMVAPMLIVLGCSEPKSSELEREVIRRTVEKAVAMPDPENLSTGIADLDQALRAAVVESARVDARRRWWRASERTDVIAWSRAAHLASMRVRDIRRRRSNLEREWREAEDLAEATLDEIVRHPIQPPSPTAARYRRTASLEMELSRSFALQDRLPDAINAARRSLEASNAVLRDRDGRLARFEDRANLSLWRAMVSDTISESKRSGSAAIVVDKLNRTLHLYQSGRVKRSFAVELGSGALERKLHQGDGATPEGRYRIREVRGPGATRFHRALLLDYPNEDDWRRFRAAKARGEMSEGVRIGGLIEIHGSGGQGADWTEGCVALSDSDMDQLVRWVRTGTPVTIVGTQ